MSENYIVFVEQPFKLDILKLATAYFRGVNWGSCLKFDEEDVVSSPFSLRSNLIKVVSDVSVDGSG